MTMSSADWAVDRWWSLEGHGRGWEDAGGSPVPPRPQSLPCQQPSADEEADMVGGMGGVAWVGLDRSLAWSWCCQPEALLGRGDPAS